MMIPEYLVDDGTGKNFEQKKGKNGADYADVRNDFRGGYPETIQNVQPLSGTAAALGDSSDLTAFGFPFTNLRFTKSAAVDNASVKLCISGIGHAVIKISGLATETIAVTALLDGVNLSDPICVRKTDGTFAVASALANGTYYVVLH